MSAHNLGMELHNAKIIMRGDTVPADASTGYPKGCIFIQTDGSTGTTLYVNEGSLTSADFNSLN